MARERIGIISKYNSKMRDNAKFFFGDSANAGDGDQGDAYVVFDGTRLVISPLPAGGILHIGDSADTTPNEVHVFDGGTDKAGRLVLYDHAGNARYLWVDSTGDLRTNTSAPANDTSGTVIGSQS